MYRGNKVCHAGTEASEAELRTKQELLEGVRAAEGQSDPALGSELQTAIKVAENAAAAGREAVAFAEAAEPSQGNAQFLALQSKSIFRVSEEEMIKSTSPEESKCIPDGHLEGSCYAHNHLSVTVSNLKSRLILLSLLLTLLSALQNHRRQFATSTECREMQAFSVAIRLKSTSISLLTSKRIES